MLTSLLFAILLIKIDIFNLINISDFHTFYKYFFCNNINFMKMRKIFYTALICISFFSCNVSFAIDDAHDHSELFRPIIIQDGMELSVADCVAAAFKNSPKIRRQKYNLDVAKSNLGIARSQYFPVIGAGVGYLHQNNSNGRYYDLKYRELPNVGVTVNQLVYNFGKSTARIKMEEFYKIGAEYEFMDSLCHALFDVKLKYYELLRQKALGQVAKNNVEINENFVKLASGKEQEDIQTAKLNLNQAQVELLESQNGYKQAKIDLNNAMYLDSQPEYKIKSTHTFFYDNDFAYGQNYDKTKAFEPDTFNFPLENAVEIAYQNSPDLHVLINTKKAMEQSLKYIKRVYLPDLTANVGYGFLNTNTQSSNNGLTVGVNLSSNVNLMELKHSIKGAQAQLNLADNEIELFKKDLYFEVKRALNNAQKAQNQIPISKTAVENSTTNLEIVEKQYKADKLDYYALQQARKDYIDSVNRYIDTMFEYNKALIEVEMAMHYHIVDIHHKSEHAMQYHSEDLIKHLNEALGCDEKEVKYFRKRTKAR